MAVFLSANNATTTLAAALTSGATTITLAAGTGSLFPSPGAGQFFSVTLNDALTGNIYEIAYCTARTGDSLTVTRGREGTTARAWLIGDFAYRTLTAGQEQLLPQLGLNNDWTGTNAFEAVTATTINATGEITSNIGFYAPLIQSTPTGYVEIGSGPSSINGSLSVGEGISSGVSVYAPLIESTPTGYLNIGTGNSSIGGSLEIGTGITLDSGPIVGFPGRFLSIEATSAVGTNSLTIPPGAHNMHVQMCGGGAGGGNCQWSGTIATSDASGSGGGAGAYFEAWIPCTPGSTGSFIIGAGGGAQSNGGPSTFSYGSYSVAAGGGTAGGFQSAASSSGGMGGVVTINSDPSSLTLIAAPGGYGSDGQSAQFLFAGNGGAGFLGGGGRAGNHGGIAGPAYGSGGGGAYDTAGTGTTYAGGSGRSGVCYITFYS